MQEPTSVTDAAVVSPPKTAFEVLFPTECACCSKPLDKKNDNLQILVCCEEFGEGRVVHDKCTKEARLPGTVQDLSVRGRDVTEHVCKFCHTAFLPMAVGRELLSHIEKIDLELATAVRAKIGAHPHLTLGSILDSTRQHFDYAPVYFLGLCGGNLAEAKVKDLLKEYLFKRRSSSKLDHCRFTIVELFAEFHTAAVFEQVINQCDKDFLIELICQGKVMSAIMRNAERSKELTQIVISRLMYFEFYFDPYDKGKVLWNVFLENKAQSDQLEATLAASPSFWHRYNLAHVYNGGFSINQKANFVKAAQYYLQVIAMLLYGDGEGIRHLGEACFWVFEYIEDAKKNAEFNWSMLIQAVHYLQNKCGVIFEKMDDNLTFVYQDSFQHGAQVQDFLKAYEEMRQGIINLKHNKGWTPWHFIILYWPKVGVSYKDISVTMHSLLDVHRAQVTPVEAGGLALAVANNWLGDINNPKQLCEAIEVLMTAGAKVDATDETGNTVINTIVTKWPFVSGAAVPLDQVLDTAEVLKGLGADVTTPNRDGNAPIQSVFLHWHRASVTEAQLARALDLLLPKPELINRQNALGCSVLHTVCSDWTQQADPVNFPLIKGTITLLLARKASLTVKTKETGETPLEMICGLHQLSTVQAMEIVQLFIQELPDLIKTESARYRAPLEIFCDKWSVKSDEDGAEAVQQMLTHLRYFLDHGADPTAVLAGEHETAAELFADRWAISGVRPDIILSAVQVLVEKMDETTRQLELNKVALLVAKKWIEARVDVAVILTTLKSLQQLGISLKDVKDSTTTLLHEVASNWADYDDAPVAIIQEAIEYLIDQKVNILAINIFDETLLHVICGEWVWKIKNLEEIQKTLEFIYQHPSIKDLLSQRDSSGRTPLLVVGKTWLGHGKTIDQTLAVMTRMVELGASPEVVDNDNRNLMSYFVEEWAGLDSMKGQHCRVLEELWKLAPNLGLTINDTESTPVPSREELNRLWRTDTHQALGIEKFATTPLHSIARDWLAKKIDMNVIFTILSSLITTETCFLTEENNGKNYSMKLVYQLRVKDKDGDTLILLMMKHLVGKVGFNYSQFRALLKLCYDYAAYVNDCDNEDKTALYLFFEKGGASLKPEEVLDFIELMAERKAYFTKSDKLGITPLHLVAEFGNEAIFTAVLNQVDDHTLVHCTVDKVYQKSLFAFIARNKVAAGAVMKVLVSRLLKTKLPFIYDRNQETGLWINVCALKATSNRLDLVKVFGDLVITDGNVEQIFHLANNYYYLWNEPVWAGNGYEITMAKIFTDESYPPKPEHMKIIETITEFCNVNPRCRGKVLTPAESTALSFLWGMNGIRQDIPQGLQKLEGLVTGAKTRADSLVSCLVLGRHYGPPRAFEFYKTACELLPNTDAFTPACRDFAVREVEKLVGADFVPALLVRAGIRKREGKDIPAAAKDYCQFLLRCAADAEAKREAVRELIALSDEIKQKSLCPTLIVATFVQLLIDMRLSKSEMQPLLRAFDLDRFFDKHAFRPNFQRTEIGFFSSVFGSDPEYSCRLSLLYLRIATESEQNFQTLKGQITTPNPSASQVATSNLLNQLLDAEQAAPPAAGVLVIVPNFLRNDLFRSRLTELLDARESQKAHSSCSSPDGGIK